MIPVSSARKNKNVRNKKHQGKNSLVCCYVSPRATTATRGDETCEANETESMFLYIILTRQYRSRM
jgi:hypothetical protein